MNTVYSQKYLAVDSDVEFANSESEIWVKKLGIGMDRVDTMNEAIQKLLTDKYLYVGMNGDVVDFLPLLKTMRSVTNTPILIATRNFTTDKQVAALGSGADLYGPYQPTTEDNIASVMAHIQRISERERTKEPIPRILFCGNMLVLVDYKMVYCNDVEVVFTAKEYGIMLYMLERRNVTITNEQIAKDVWSGGAVSDEAIREILHKLRKKLADSGFNGAEIVNLRNMGYRFQTQADK